MRQYMRFPPSSCANLFFPHIGACLGSQEASQGWKLIKTPPNCVHTAGDPVGLSVILISASTLEASIPSSGRLGSISLGIPHQNSRYLELQLYDHFNTQYNYIYESHIAYSHTDLLGLANVVFFDLNCEA